MWRGAGGMAHVARRPLLSSYRRIGAHCEFRGRHTNAGIAITCSGSRRRGRARGRSLVAQDKGANDSEVRGALVWAARSFPPAEGSSVRERISEGPRIRVATQAKMCRRCRQFQGGSVGSVWCRRGIGPNARNEWGSAAAGPGTGCVIPPSLPYSWFKGAGNGCQV